MNHSYEVEIKSLLGSKENADNLRRSLEKNFPGTKVVKQEKQLNHYFNTPKDFSDLKKNLSSLIPKEKLNLFEDILNRGQKVSIRTRDADGTVIFVIKASVGDDSSSNGVKRIEFEAIVSKSLGELDAILLKSGCTYQAKWSREREEYKAGDLNVCFDKNAGYGYVAEFEKVVPDENLLDNARMELASVMDKLGVSELKQDRLERMFAHYNSHWMDYYGTDKTFNIE